MLSSSWNGTFEMRLCVFVRMLLKFMFVFGVLCVYWFICHEIEHNLVITCQLESGFVELDRIL